MSSSSYCVVCMKSCVLFRNLANIYQQAQRVCTCGVWVWVWVRTLVASDFLGWGIDGENAEGAKIKQNGHFPSWRGGGSGGRAEFRFGEVNSPPPMCVFLIWCAFEMSCKCFPYEVNGNDFGHCSSWKPICHTTRLYHLKITTNLQIVF